MLNVKHNSSSQPVPAGVECFEGGVDEMVRQQQRGRAPGNLGQAGGNGTITSCGVCGSTRCYDDPEYPQVRCLPRVVVLQYANIRQTSAQLYEVPDVKDGGWEEDSVDNTRDGPQPQSPLHCDWGDFHLRSDMLGTDGLYGSRDGGMVIALPRVPVELVIYPGGFAVPSAHLPSGSGNQGHELGTERMENSISLGGYNSYKPRKQERHCGNDCGSKEGPQSCYPVASRGCEGSQVLPQRPLDDCSPHREQSHDRGGNSQRLCSKATAVQERQGSSAIVQHLSSVRTSDQHRGGCWIQTVPGGLCGDGAAAVSSESNGIDDLRSVDACYEHRDTHCRSPMCHLYDDPKRGIDSHWENVGGHDQASQKSSGSLNTSQLDGLGMEDDFVGCETPPEPPLVVYARFPDNHMGPIAFPTLSSASDANDLLASSNPPSHAAYYPYLTDIPHADTLISILQSRGRPPRRLEPFQERNLTKIILGWFEEPKEVVAIFHNLDTFLVAASNGIYELDHDVFTSMRYRGEGGNVVEGDWVEAFAGYDSDDDESAGEVDEGMSEGGLENGAWDGAGEGIEGSDGFVHQVGSSMSMEYAGSEDMEMDRPVRPKISRRKLASPAPQRERSARSLSPRRYRTIDVREDRRQ
ncbi:hypothetical protein BJ508DRAFT_19989 [Ascobolus immersus RN42]|uniref:Uncharacterized protein n=1 Tax=Ascobolus immersus RN42 TaxID=1160509 RepID=A0A3N4IFI1_ASCIM|nr:hypothetical protein BJ508DRAFT_19989 [Ascobolus immersus RN42]